MSGSGKGLLGLWLYRMADDQWNIKDSSGQGSSEEKLAIKETDETTTTNSMIFSLKDQPGGLARALKVFQVGPSIHPSILNIFSCNYSVEIINWSQSKGINVVHIESRRSRRRNSQFEILVDVQCNEKNMNELVTSLQSQVSAVKLAEFDLGVDPPPPQLLPAESFGCYLSTTVTLSLVQFFHLPP